VRRREYASLIIIEIIRGIRDPCRQQRAKSSEIGIELGTFPSTTVNRFHHILQKQENRYIFQALEFHSMQYSIRNFSEALFLRFMVRSREDTDWGGGIVRTCIEIKCGVQVMPLACGPSTEVDELKLSSGHLESPRSAQVLYGRHASNARAHRGS
jgi:hypothetical protein